MKTFDREGADWRKQGYISSKQKEKLEDMVKSFEANFRVVYNQEKSQQMRDAKVLRHEVLEVVRLVSEEKFELGQMEEVYQHVKRLFFQNEEDHAYFKAEGLTHASVTERLPGSGIDLQRFQPQPLPTREPFRFLLVARLLYDKGVAEYVQAARTLLGQA